MITQWENECIALSFLSVDMFQFLVVAEYFSLADHTSPTSHEPAWQKMAQFPLNGTAQPVNIEKEGLCPTAGSQGEKTTKKQPHSLIPTFSLPDYGTITARQFGENSRTD